MRDPISCDCVCEPQDCPAFAQWDETTCSCQCEDGYEMCGGTCYPVCDGSGMTGERDPNTCACTCIEGTNADTCACPAGYIYVNGQCQRFECKGGPTEYTCYINGERCGYGCTEKGEHCRVGACYPALCEGIGSFAIRNYWDKYGGCEYDTTFCSPWDRGDWYCFDKQTQQPCCDAKAPDFNECYFGSCINPCIPYDNLDPNYGHADFKLVTDRFKGCFFDNGIRCLLYEGKWTCYINDYFMQCGTGCDSPIHCGDCSLTFCPDGSTWDAAKEQCCVQDGSSQVCCDRSAVCYRDSLVCGVTCPDMGQTCGRGLCYDPGCPAGFTFTYESGFYGCKSESIFVTKAEDGTGPYNCLYQGRIGALGCTDLSAQNCAEIYLEECSSNRQCPYGTTVTATCICDTNPNAHIGDYCCAPGHTFTNGGCTLITCDAGQIADENGICKEACPNDTEITSTCVCGGTTHTDKFNRTICCDADHSWDETTEMCV